MTAITFLYATAPDQDLAEGIALALLEQGRAACVNVIPGIRSIYLWNGAVERSDGVAMIVKTTASQADAACDLILAMHPYETPTIAALPVDERMSSAPFCNWIRSAASGPA